MSKIIYALGLSSGGLDSILSALLLLSYGIKVQWVTFETPFFFSENAKLISKIYNIPLWTKNVTEIYNLLLNSSDCRFGRNMNPCVHCHSMMFNLAGKIMKNNSFDFMFSGEVLGQRPMSQNINSLKFVEKKSGYEGYIVRPLSGKLLPKTIPEMEGVINKDVLLNISGRSRKKQMQLAKQFSLKSYPSPGGGCLLTDEKFSVRLKDLMLYKIVYTEKDLNLLRIGRHMRLNSDTKIIIGRNYGENKILLSYFDLKCDILIECDEFPGPMVIIFNGKNKFLKLAGSICASYTKFKNKKSIIVNIYMCGIKRQYIVPTIFFSEFNKFLIL